MSDTGWMVFAVASLVLVGTLGQDMIRVMSRSVAQGASAGVAAAGGSASDWLAVLRLPHLAWAQF